MEFNGEDLMKAVLMKIIQMEVFDNCAKDGITPEQLIDFCEWSEETDTFMEFMDTMVKKYSPTARAVFFSEEE
jgi:hypothetical protein